jgi:glucose dehydrogenase
VNPESSPRCLTLALLLLALCACTPEMELSYAGPVAAWPKAHGFDEWPYYTPLDQIRIWNARYLEQEWAARVPLGREEASLTVRDQTLWVCGGGKARALDPETGQGMAPDRDPAGASECAHGGSGEPDLRVKSPLEATDYRVVRRAPADPSRLFGLPDAPPPWTVLEAVDRQTGMPRWSVALGTTRNVLPFPFWFKFGANVTRPPILTATGVIFVVTQDRFLRAFRAHDGDEVWAKLLPGEPVAGPISYRVTSRSKQQVVVLVASGLEELTAVSFSAPGDPVY